MEIDTSYDRVPYPSLPFRVTHPEHLAIIGLLYGFETPRPETSKVLEIGCASGGNLLPLAARYPQAKFYGIDASRYQIGLGNDSAYHFGLTNVTLNACNVIDFSPGETKFDFIIVHGVYSWVSPEVQDAILQLCASSLSENGVAYVSYNVYPGWHTLGMVRDMLQFHTQGIHDPQTQIAFARQLGPVMNDAILDNLKSYKYSVVKQLESCSEGKSGESYFYHEYLHGVNCPMYFCQFTQNIERFGLKYLADSDLDFLRFESELMKARQLSEDPVRSQQYLDFFLNRKFRRSIICRGTQPVLNNHDLTRLKELHIRSGLKCENTMPDRFDCELQFQHPLGGSSKSNHPVLNAALLYLQSKWPRMVSVQEVFDQAIVQGHLTSRPNLDDSDRQLVERIASRFLIAYLQGSIELTLGASPIEREIRPQPVAWPFAQLQAIRGDRVVTSLKHEPVRIDSEKRYLLSLMDGTLEFDEIVENAIQKSRQQAKADAATQNSILCSESAIRESISHLIDQSLLQRIPD